MDPALFSAGTLPVVETAQNHTKWDAWFLDDGHLMNTAAQLSGLSALLPVLDHHCLSLNWTGWGASLFPAGSLLHCLTAVPLTQGITALNSYVGPRPF